MPDGKGMDKAEALQFVRQMGGVWLKEQLGLPEGPPQCGCSACTLCLYHWITPIMEGTIVDKGESDS